MERKSSNVITKISTLNCAVLCSKMVFQNRKNAVAVNRHANNNSVTPITQTNLRGGWLYKSVEFHVLRPVWVTWVICVSVSKLIVLIHWQCQNVHRLLSRPIKKTFAEKGREKKVWCSKLKFILLLWLFRNFHDPKYVSRLFVSTSNSLWHQLNSGTVLGITPTRTNRNWSDNKKSLHV